MARAVCVSGIVRGKRTLVLKTLKELIGLFGRAAERKILVLAGAMVVVAVLEAASIAVVLPFIQLVLNPDEAGGFALDIATLLGLGGAQPVVAVGWLALGLFLTSTVLSAGTSWFMFTFVASENRRLATKLLRGYVQQPYSFFLERNTTALAKNVLYELDMLSNNVLVPLGNLAGRLMMVLCIFGFLIYTDPVIAFALTVAVGGLYSVLYLSIRRPVARLSARRVASNTERFRTAHEALGSVKEAKVLGRECFFLHAFDVASAVFTRVFALNQIIGSVPRFLLEAVAIGGVLGLLVLMLQRGESGAGIVPLLGLYAAAVYRIMPALQQIYTGVTNLRFCGDLITVLRSELAMIDAHAAVVEAPEPEVEPVAFTHSVELRDVSLRYAGAESDVLDGLSLSIPKNSSIGVVGETGSGKSTLIDVLLGLLQPQAGALLLDGVALREEQLRGWQRLIGYVPQFIYLSDSSIRNNIAFGIDASQIDQARVEEAARLAGLHEFIVNQSPEGYDTVVGERGIRLSGGQRQRIGIARALYHDPDVLILDEATSSLDNITEHGVMKAIRALSGRKTIVIVAHRLSTVQDCDQIVVIDKGRVREHGTYNDLMARDGALAALDRVARR